MSRLLRSCPFSQKVEERKEGGQDGKYPWCYFLDDTHRKDGLDGRNRQSCDGLPSLSYFLYRLVLRAPSHPRVWSIGSPMVSPWITMLWSRAWYYPMSHPHSSSHCCWHLPACKMAMVFAIISVMIIQEWLLCLPGFWNLWSLTYDSWVPVSWHLILQGATEM